MQILVADDCLLMRTLLQDILQAKGFEVLIATNGHEAIKLLNQGKVRLALLDWDMPGMVGPEICEQLTKTNKISGLYIILLTGNSSSEHIVEAFEKGASDYVTKPFCKEELLARVCAGKRFVEMQSQLAQAQKLEAIGQLAAGIAHEINTPIQYIGDNTRFIDDAFVSINRLIQDFQELTNSCEQGIIDPQLVSKVKATTKSIDLEFLQDEVPQATKQLLEGVDRVAHIVRAMKEFSHPGSEEKQSLDLNHAIECTSIVTRNEWKYVADIVFDLDESLSPVRCLPGYLNQVFMNLIVNAAHAIESRLGDSPGQKGKITISTRSVDGYVEIRISDTGTGIPVEIRKQIFNPFFTTKPIGKGTGQGLAIVYSVVTDKHGGTIDLESEVGVGTTFIIRLPTEPIGETRQPTTKNQELVAVNS